MPPSRNILTNYLHSTGELKLLLKLIVLEKRFQQVESPFAYYSVSP